MKDKLSTIRCSLTMPAYKMPPIFIEASHKNQVLIELEKKYGTRMSLESVSYELNLEKSVIINKISNSKYHHIVTFRKLLKARVFTGKNSSFWTESIARILVEGNINEN